MKKIPALLIVCVMTVIVPGTVALAGVILPELQEILEGLGPNEEVQVIVTLTDQVNLKNFKEEDKKLRRSRIIRALKSKAEKNQENIKKFLREKKVKKIKSFWIFNGFALTAKAKVLENLAALEGVQSISLDAKLSIPEPQVTASESPPEWNINLINVPALWSQGYTGSGIVLANMDSGVDMTHQELASRWRGGSNSWFDPHGDYDMPYDYSGHGTAVMGILVGGDAGGTAIGVAPDAQWIAVKIFNDAGNSYDSYIVAGFQWLLDPDGNPATDDAPDVINNSWGYPYYAGCYRSSYFQPVIQALKTSGIGVVFSAGNEGPFSSTDEAPANYSNSFAVGAVDETQTIAFFSARGPSSCDDSIYPEVVAPGLSVRTSYLGNDYAYVSGTSIAAPHVAGVMGLLMSAYSSLSINVIEAAITDSALDLGPESPDNAYGYGLLDVMAAYNLLNQSLSQPPVATNDHYTIPRNSAALLNILANDADPDGTIDATSVIFRSGIKTDITIRGGTVVANTDGTVSYTPDGSGGPDYFWYTVTDNNGIISNEARVRINRIRNAAGLNAAPASSPTSGRTRITR